MSNSIVVSILEKSTCKRSSGVVATIGHKGAFGVLPSYWRQCLQALMIVSFVWPFLATKNVLATEREYGHRLGGLHPYDIHLGQQSGALWAP